jgi:hypothetical protein
MNFRPLSEYRRHGRACTAGGPIPSRMTQSGPRAGGGAEAYVDEAPLVGVEPTISSNPARSLGTPSASFAAAT